MKKFIAGLVIGVLLTSAGIGLASQDVIRIFIDGQEIVPDVPPQIIDGRVMVPARFIAEPLGATVEWDDESRAVVIKNQPEKHILEMENMITAREMVNKYGDQFNLSMKGDGYVYKDGNRLFSWEEEGTIIDGKIYIPLDTLEKFLFN